MHTIWYYQLVCQFTNEMAFKQLKNKYQKLNSIF